jgi:ribose 5-phosphate isomerase B
MSRKTVAIAADHAGFEMKSILAEELRKMDYEVIDFGTNGPDSVDYPDFAHQVAQAVETGSTARGVLVCGSGIGMSIAANRHDGVRAALCQNAEIAGLSRQHNNSNVLVLAGRFIDQAEALRALRAFMETEFEGGRHERRLAKLAAPAVAEER